MPTKLDLSKTYQIKGESSLLKPKDSKLEIFEIESMYSTPALSKTDYNLPNLILTRQGHKYITFAYYLNGTRQLIKLRPEDLREWTEKKVEPKKV